MKRELACIICPGSCILTICESDSVLQVIGNKCDKGVDFAEKEVNDPERTLTTTVKLTTGGLLPVRSKSMVKKYEIKTLVAQLRDTVVKPPVVIGQVVASGLGVNSVDIVASDDMEQ